MPLKSDVRQIIGLFAIQIIFLLFGVYFVLRDSYLIGAIFLNPERASVYLHEGERKKDEREASGLNNLF